MEKHVRYTREGAGASYYKFSDADIEKANSISIVDWAKQQGYPVKDDRRWAEIKGQGGLTIDKYNNRWYCHSQRKGGGPIQLVMHLNSLSWSDAMQELLGNEGSYEMAPRTAYKEPSKDNFQLPERNDTYKHIYAYLVKSRKIHPDVISEFVKKKLLYENTKKSCVFVGVNKEGLPKYANIRSTNTVGEAFKGEASLSDKRFGFARTGTNNVLTIMEAPIDVLSYMTIFKIHNLSHLIENDHLLSLGGVSDIALVQYLEDHQEITKIKLGLDNDEVGNDACNRIYQQYSYKYEIERIYIKEKDFNETLIKDIEKLQLRQAMLQMQTAEGQELMSEEELEPV